MKRKAIVQIVAAVVVVIFALGIWLSGDEVKIRWLRFYSLAVIGAVILLAAWDHFIWRAPIVQKIPGVPRNIRGTWYGELTSFWKDPLTGESPPPKRVFLVVRQTSSVINAVLLTDESRSNSRMAKIIGDESGYFLMYVYLNEPGVRFEHRSPIHYGSASLNIIGQPATRLLGKYWTSRDSKGELDFDSRSPKIIDDYDSGLKQFSDVIKKGT